MKYDQKFADRVVVYVKGGDGGAGCLSFKRENYGAKVPDGGSGGDGGDVYFKASMRLQNLYELRRAHFTGNNVDFVRQNLSLAMASQITAGL